MPVEFQVYGLPAPQGSKRHVGRGVMIESSKNVKPWREAVKWAAIEAHAARVDGAVRVNMAFTLPKPKTVKRPRPDRKPDLDKLIRSTMDALVEANVIEDDARVVEIRAWKVYPGGLAALCQPGAVIHVSEAPA